MFFGNVYARIVFFLQSGRLFSGKQTRSDVQRNRLIPRSWVQVFNSLLAQQVLFLNKLIQRCLKEDWGLVCQEDGIEQQTICCFVFGGWTDQWKRCEVLLNSYHIEIFQQSVANDLVELQQCTDLLPEATWMGSRGPVASRESSV